MPSADELREAVLYVIRAGLQLRPEGLAFLKELPGDLSPLQVVKEALERARAEGRDFLGREELEAAFRTLRKPEEPEKGDELALPAFGKGRKEEPAREQEARVEVLMDPTGELGSEGSLKDFLTYFRSRFRQLSSLLRRRLDARDALSVSEALRARLNEEVKMIGMVREKREVGGKVVAVLEDEEAAATVVFTARAGQEAYEKARRLVPDQVVCVRAVKVARDLFAARELIGPDVPAKRARSGGEPAGPLYAVLISDIHFGSKAFMADAFQRLLAWLRGELGNGPLRRLAGAVKYLVVAGDLVDGVGVYPGQEAELTITDVHAQYEGVAELLAEVPEHVELVLAPGNHDAVRKALPQPAVPEEYAAPLYADGRTHMLGNPCLVALHGVRFLIYHGNSFDDLASAVPGTSFDRPLDMMKLMLWARHLAPVYGLKTALAPTSRDLLVVEEVPDVFHTGHLHVLGCGAYRGILLVNSSAWQGQTAYQKARGIEPQPGRAVLVDLSSLKALELDFTKPGLWA